MQQDNIKSRQRPKVGFKKIPVVYAMLWEPGFGPHLLTLKAPSPKVQPRHSFQRHGLQMVKTRSNSHE